MMIIPKIAHPCLADWETAGDVGHVSCCMVRPFGSKAAIRRERRELSSLPIFFISAHVHLAALLAPPLHTLHILPTQSPIPRASVTMVKTIGNDGKTRAQSRDPPTAVTEKTQKRATADDANKKPRVANKTTGKWFTTVVFANEPDQLVAEKLMTEDLRHRIPDEEFPPTPLDGEHVIHQEYFLRGLGFPLYSFVRVLLCCYGCQLHHIPPNGILHITNFITFCEIFLGTSPHFELFRYFFRVRVQTNRDAIYDLGGADTSLTYL